MANKQLAEPEGTDAFAGTEDIEEFFPQVPQAQEKPADPTLDPSSPKWNPKRYFAAQPKLIVTVHKNESDFLSDPSGQKPAIQPFSINGYRLDIVKGVPTRVPRDFALLIQDIGAGYIHHDIADALER